MASSEDLLTEMKLKIEEYVRELVREVGATPNLGLATTAELINELRVRLDVHYPNVWDHEDLKNALRWSLDAEADEDFLGYSTFHGSPGDSTGG